MESAQFEKLEEKVELAIRIIADLKQSKQALEEEIERSNLRNSELEKQNEELTQNKGELENTLSEKSSTLANADEKVQNLIAKLEAENLEEIFQ